MRSLRVTHDCPLKGPSVYSKLSHDAGDKVVQQSAKHFALRLNHCLDDIGTPGNIRERVSILSKLLDIPKHQARSLLEGQQFPDPDLVQKIADEFEVDPKWLSGAT